MNRYVTLLVLVVVTLALGAGLYGTVGVSDTESDRSVTIDVVEQADGLIGIDTGDADNEVITDGNETVIATITNQVGRQLQIHESVTGPNESTDRIYSLVRDDSMDVSVHVDCTGLTTETYEIELVAETAPDGDLRIESTTTVTVRCR